MTSIMRKSTMLRRTRQLVVFAALVMASFPTAGFADYPDRPVTIIVPFPPGGANDIVVRILSDPLSKALGQPVVVENRGGAGGNIGIAAAARAQPDGYTILIAASGFAANPSLYAKVAYDPFKDFLPIADLVFFPCVIAVRPDLGITTLSDLIAYAKAHPGKLNYASPGIGTVPHLAAELLKLSAGIDMVHIPYTGAGPAAQALVGGTVEVGSMSMSAALPQIKAGHARGLASTGWDRWPDLPHVPTLGEAGFPEAVAETWQGLLAPAGTPDEAVNRIATEVVAILQRPAIVDRFRKAGFGVVGRGPASLRARIAEEVPKWRDVITRARIKAE
jgi:tripartite-type tricarboxylate transporter receptor subunit TctC